MRKKNILFIGISAVLLCFFAFYNRFPLVFWDTATYLSMAINNKVLMERPIFYGLFMKHISMRESLWFVVIVQAILLSTILYIYFKYFIVKKNKANTYFLIYITIIVFFTGASYYTGRLMPDIFTSIFILSLGLLYFVNKLTLYEKVYISIILIISSIMHNMHVMFFQITIFITFILVYVFYKKKIKFFKTNRLILLTSLMIISYSSSYFSSWIYRGKFESYKGSHVFMMGRLISTGILQEYLKENCDGDTYSLCRYKEDLSTSFMWDVKHSPLYKDGGWEGTKEKYTKLIFEILSKPKYLKKYIIKSSEASLSQFFYFDIPKEKGYTKGMSPYVSIENYYKDYITYFKQSLQNQNRLNIIDRTNNFQFFIVIFSLLFIILSLLNKKRFNSLSNEIKFFFIFFLFFLILNSILVGFFSEVRFRYQGRIVWLISLPVFIYIVNNLSGIFNSLKEKLKK